jgi:hypothetical protein
MTEGVGRGLEGKPGASGEIVNHHVHLPPRRQLHPDVVNLVLQISALVHHFRCHAAGRVVSPVPDVGLKVLHQAFRRAVFLFVLNDHVT